MVRNVNKDMKKSTGVKSKKKILLAVIAVLLLIAIFACGIYLSDYYHADINAIEAFSYSNNIEWSVCDDGSILCEADGATKGLIFYPGGKVEYTAYVPLMQACAESGITCIITKMPFNLAVLDINAADGVKEKYPEIEKWYIGGHSLGGSMAASYLEDKANEYEGLILLGSYSTADLSDTALKVLSIFGSEDEVMNCQKYDENKGNLPETFTEIIIEGGCHAYFGVYGEQEGDGTPTITCDEQIKETADAIKMFVE